MHYTADEPPAIPGARSRDTLLSWITRPLLLLIGLALSHVAWADFELIAPDGRRVQLRDDGTWKYQEANTKDPQQPKGPQGEAVLRLEQKIERGNHCRLVFSLTNNLPYEIVHIIPYFSAYRANGVVHETVNAAFQSIRPFDKVERVADFERITCPEIARVQVLRGDRCEMGNLTKFSEANGQCLALVRVAPSDLMRFDK